MREILLRQMKTGESGVVAGVRGRGELGRRIRDMGIVPGASIRMEGSAPLKDPVAVRLRDCTLSLRNNEADNVLVRVEDQSHE